MAKTAIEIINDLIVDHITKRTIVSETQKDFLTMLISEQEQRVIDDLIMIRDFYTNRPFEVDPSDPNIYLSVHELLKERAPSR